MQYDKAAPLRSSAFESNMQQAHASSRKLVLDSSLRRSRQQAQHAK
jgi:hypothetical protein